ncbi:lachesin-like [Argonauta hians]
MTIQTINPTMIIFIFLCCALLTITPGESEASNRFEDQKLRKYIIFTQNVTAVVGQDVILPCPMEHLNDDRFIWRGKKNSLLTIHGQRITDDDRIMVDGAHIGEWDLRIRDVELSDEGQYTCQINTIPVKMINVNLFVSVPPKLDMLNSRKDKTAEEGDKITLVCNVSGIPQPNVIWYHKSPGSKKANEGIGMTEEDQDTPNQYCVPERGIAGEVLMIQNISRNCNGMYECIADNEVGNVAHHLFNVKVLFPPQIYLPVRSIGQEIAKETILECKITAMPQGVTVWKKDGKVMQTGRKYKIYIYAYDEYTIIATLFIRQITEDDYGVYICQTSNRLGRDDKSIVLYNIRATSTSTPTTQVTPTEKIHSTPAQCSNTATILYSLPSVILILITIFLKLDFLSGE